MNPTRNFTGYGYRRINVGKIQKRRTSVNSPKSVKSNASV